MFLLLYFLYEQFFWVGGGGGRGGKGNIELHKKKGNERELAIVVAKWTKTSSTVGWYTPSVSINKQTYISRCEAFCGDFCLNPKPPDVVGIVRIVEVRV
jgi:hypothetical protein